MINESEEPNRPIKTSNNKKDQLRDLPDNEHDAERMKPEETTLDLPDVKDIPGQENIIPPKMNSFADTTIASDDEEGVSVFGDEDAEDDMDLNMGNNADVSNTEKLVLESADKDMPTEDEENLKMASLDQTDAEGTPLNEGSLGSDVSGGDLDTSGVDNDDAMENIGEEDEENNTYSLGGDNNDDTADGIR